MDDRESDEPSFDPRSWRRGADGVQRKRPGIDDSFDPKSWGAKPADASAPKKKSGGSALVVIVPVAVLALAAGGGALWLTMGRHSGPGHAATNAATPRQPTATQPAGPKTEVRTLTVSGAGDLPAALTGAGVSPTEAQAALQAATAALGANAGELKVSLNLTPGAAAPLLASLDLRRDDGSGVVVTRQPDGRFLAQAAGANLTDQVKVVRAQMDDDSFYSSAVAAGVDDSLIPSFLQAFTYDFDFQREISVGDVFEAVFDQPVDATGAAVGQGKLLFASLETSKKSVALYWFVPAGKTGGWYDSNGRSVIRSFMRTPVVGARISSPFGMRLHPVLGFEKMHNGTDFAAPIGTPIYAAGDGVVVFSGMKGPNGNFVKLHHPNGWDTLYLHQNRIEPDIVVGAHVSQSQQIGEVGATGVDSNGKSSVTGPHLHYEVHINNVPVDPMSIPVDAGLALAGPDMTNFVKERNRIDQLRSAQGG